MKKIDCEICKRSKIFLDALSCEECHSPKYFNNELTFDICPICGCKDLYKKKDFNQAIGCLIILIGAIFVPWTYGISLLLLSLVDYVLYNRVKDSVECYKCKSEYKGILVPDHIKPFDHHTAELYEYSE